VPPHWVAQVPVARRRTSPLVTIVLVAVLVFIGFLLVGMASLFMGTPHGEGPAWGGQVGIVTIEGVIRDGGEGGLFLGPAGARGIMRQIRAAGKDDGIKAVVLLVNSPGGSAAASHSIYQELKALRHKKKVVACMTDVAASGGYYVSCGADKIVAQGATLTGSIGVIFGGVGYYGLMKKLGITDETVTAGKYKDIGSGQRPMTGEERQILQSMLESIYGQFVGVVAEGRKLPPAKVRQLAQGRVYTGAQAKEVGLVDELGSFYDAVKLAGKLGGIRGEPKIKYMAQSRGLLSELAGAEGSLSRLLRGEAFWNRLPLQGPALLMPYSYRLEPSLPLPTLGPGSGE
jgi:protease-4